MTRKAINLQQDFAQFNEQLAEIAPNLSVKHKQMGMEIMVRASLVANGYDVNRHMDRLLKGDTVELPSVADALEDFKAVAAKRPDAFYNAITAQAIKHGEALGHVVSQDKDVEQAINRQIGVVVEAHNNQERNVGFTPQHEVEREAGEITISEAEMAELEGKSVQEVEQELER